MRPMLKRMIAPSGFKLGLLITLVFCTFKLPVCQTTDSGVVRFLNTIENVWMDWKFNLRLSRAEPKELKQFRDRADVVIVAVDEKSVRTEGLGAWPWPRVKMAGLTKILHECGAKIIGFDMVFAEAENNRVQAVLTKIIEQYEKTYPKDQKFESVLHTFRAESHGDRIFESILNEVENVVLGYFFFTSADEVQKLDAAEIREGKNSIGFGTVAYTASYPGVLASDAFPKALGVRANLPGLSEAVETYGHFNQIPDPDRIYRHVPLVFAFEDNLYPSLALQILSLYHQKPVVVVAHTLTKKEYLPGYIGLYLGPAGMPGPQHVEIPVESGGRFRVNYYGRQKTFLHISAADVLQGDQRACKAVFGKIVLVGVTTIGIYDLRPTPFDHSYPGVEIHASVIQNVINRDFMLRSEHFTVWEVLFMVLMGIFLSVLLNRVRLTLGLGLTVGFLIGLGVADYFVLFLNGLQAHILWPVMHACVLFAGVSVYRYVTEEREKRKLRRAFHFYLAPSVIDIMLAQPSKLKLGGERRELTVLFSDIRGFTTISEKLDPEDLTELLNEYLTPMTDIVFRHRGTLDKYMGDAIMAFFGAPVAYKEHAEEACHCALNMMSKLGELQKSWKERGLNVLDIGIGINTGYMSVGNMGSQTLFDYTVIGDHVNLGSRLEGLNKIYSTHIIVSEFTRSLVSREFTFRQLDVVRVKGKQEPVQIHELLHAGLPDQHDAWLQLFHQALSAYRTKQWDVAIEMFQGIPHDPVSRMYLERCHVMKRNPPGDDWDGYFVPIEK